MTHWITPRLGTCKYDERPPGDSYLLDVRHLVDKGGNSPRVIAECIDTGVAALQSGRAVLVACDFGVSRSNSIAAGILSVIEKCTFDEAVGRVLAATGETEIKLDMIESVRRALPQNEVYVANGTVLLTGGTGFIGRFLAPRLRKSQRVATPGRDILNLDDGALKLAAYCRSEGVSQIVHLAYPRVYTNVGAMAASLAMLRAVLDTCKLLAIRLVFVSSTVVYGGHKATLLIADENTPFRPKGAYGDAKFLEEMLVATYTERGDIRRSICRLAPVYGPGGDRPRLIKNFQESILSGKTIQTHLYLNGRPALDLLYVDDAVEAIARTLESNANGTFHFGSGTTHTTIEIAEIIARGLNRPLTVKELLIDEYIANIQMNAAKAQAALDWSPTVPLEEGISKRIASER